MFERPVEPEAVAERDQEAVEAQRDGGGRFRGGNMEDRIQGVVV